MHIFTLFIKKKKALNATGTFSQALITSVKLLQTSSSHDVVQQKKFKPTSA